MKSKMSPTFRRLVPNLVTISALGTGMSALRMNFEGHLEAALGFLLLAMFLDALDGKLARLLDSVSPFGAELDTLSDFFNFGAVPGILVYYNLFADTEHASLGWIAALFIVICCALRLARFNVARKTDCSSDFFVGIPAPALACLAMLPIFIDLCAWDAPTHPVLRAFYIIGVGMLAISNIPTISIKNVGLKTLMSLPASLALIAGAYSLYSNPWPTLVFANLLYLAILPLFYLRQSRLSKTPQEDYAHSADRG
jgi:CDP-diacylglycerol--serine O-phosphatidyltransferase